MLFPTVEDLVFKAVLHKDCLDYLKEFGLEEEVISQTLVSLAKGLWGAGIDLANLSVSANSQVREIVPKID